MTVDLRVLSLGAGVQSSALYLMALRGEFAEVPDCAIFADTQCEPPWVYGQLKYLEKTGASKIPIHTVTAGNLGRQALQCQQAGEFSNVPFWIRGEDGREVGGRRQCTREFKITPITQKIRELLGLKKGERALGRYRAELWIGISMDEVIRAKPNRERWLENRHPFVLDRLMHREEIKKWMRDNGYPIPFKSACFFCPYHDNRWWAAIRNEYPYLWQQARSFDKRLRDGKLRGMKQHVYLHRSLKPLGEAPIDEPDDGQLDLFGNECEGMCGV
jgi:hypothetical protein